MNKLTLVTDHTENGLEIKLCSNERLAKILGKNLPNDTSVSYVDIADNVQTPESVFVHAVANSDDDLAIEVYNEFLQGKEFVIDNYKQDDDLYTFTLNGSPVKINLHFELIFTKDDFLLALNEFKNEHRLN